MNNRPPLYKTEHFAGYKWRDIEKFLPQDQMQRFERWMRGQTLALADDGDHVVYTHDFERFLARLPIVD